MGTQVRLVCPLCGLKPHYTRVDTDEEFEMKVFQVTFAGKRAARPGETPRKGQGRGYGSISWQDITDSFTEDAVKNIWKRRLAVVRRQLGV